MSIFADDWRECMIEQYKEVIRNDDRVTLKSLIVVMHDVGFTDDEMAQYRMEATMKNEVPDEATLKYFMEQAEQKETVPAVQENPQGEQDFQPHPLECQCPSCIDLNMTPHDDDGQPIPPEDRDEDEPTQLTMF